MRLLIEEHLSLQDWELFVKHFQETLDDLGTDVPDSAKEDAMRWLRSTRNEFRPAEPAEIEAFKAKGKGGATSCPFRG